MLNYTVALVFSCLLVLLQSCNEHKDKSSVGIKDHKALAGSVSVTEEDITGYKIIGVKDGDTFTLLMNGKEQTIRLAHIDCPEKKQPFGSKAKQFASSLCFGEYVTLIHDNKYDRNRRLIAEIVLENGKNVNKELVKQGLAWHYKKYSDDGEYAQLEIAARTQKNRPLERTRTRSPLELEKTLNHINAKAAHINHCRLAQLQQQ